MRETYIQFQDLDAKKRRALFVFLQLLYAGGVSKLFLRSSTDGHQWVNVSVWGQKAHALAIALLGKKPFQTLKRKVIIVRQGNRGWNNYEEHLNTAAYKAPNKSLQRTPPRRSAARRRR